MLYPCWKLNCTLAALKTIFLTLTKLILYGPLKKFPLVFTPALTNHLFFGSSTPIAGSYWFDRPKQYITEVMFLIVDFHVSFSSYRSWRMVGSS